MRHLLALTLVLLAVHSSAQSITASARISLLPDGCSKGPINDAIAQAVLVKDLPLQTLDRFDMFIEGHATLQTTYIMRVHEGSGLTGRLFASSGIVTIEPNTPIKTYSFIFPVPQPIVPSPSVLTFSLTRDGMATGSTYICSKNPYAGDSFRRTGGITGPVETLTTSDIPFTFWSNPTPNSGELKVVPVDACVWTPINMQIGQSFTFGAPVTVREALVTIMPTDQTSSTQRFYQLKIYAGDGISNLPAPVLQSDPFSAAMSNSAYKKVIALTPPSSSTSFVFTPNTRYTWVIRNVPDPNNPTATVLPYGKAPLCPNAIVGGRAYNSDGTAAPSSDYAFSLLWNLDVSSSSSFRLSSLEGTESDPDPNPFPSWAIALIVVGGILIVAVVVVGVVLAIKGSAGVTVGHEPMVKM